MKVQDLDGFKRIYTMFAAVDGLKVLKEVFKSQVEVQPLCRSCLLTVVDSSSDFLTEKRPRHCRG